MSESFVRLDKWLWAARFFKNRNLAQQAINGGKVHVNNQRSKASQKVHIGDTLTITKAPYRFEIIVTGLSDKRGNADQAKLLYQETEQSQQTREQLALERKLLYANQGPNKKPDKRQRQQIIKFIRKK